MRILLAGHVSYNLMKPFCQKIREKYPDWQIDALGLNRPGTRIREEEKKYFNKVVSDFSFSYKEFFTIIISWIFFKAFIKFLFTNKNLIRIKTYFKIKSTLITVSTPLLKQKYYTSIFREYDIINFQYIENISTQYSSYLNDKNKVLLTFWGSDLMQMTGLAVYTRQLALIKRADLIVVHSLEMREIFLSKYGREFLPKIRLNFFGLGDDKFNILDNAKKDEKGKAMFREKWGVPQGKITIMLGYSGAKGNQHINVLDVLEKQREKWGNHIHLLIPMTYNNNDKEYFESVKNKVKALSYSCTHFLTYLSDNDIAYLYNITDLFINVRESDAFNATMLELMYLGKICAVGSWLPYSALGRAGIKYFEVEDIENIAGFLNDFFNNKLEIETINNKEKVYNLVSNNFTISKWCMTYQELYNL